MADKILYFSCFGFIFGVLLRSFILLNFYFVLFLFLISLFILLLSYFTQLKWVLIGAVFVLAFSLGILRLELKESFPLGSFTGETKVVFEGIIIDEPDIRENNQKLVVEQEISGVTTKFLVTTGLDEHFKYGDMVSLSGKVSMPENFTTDQGKEFDYVNYLRKDGIFYLINYPEIEVLSEGHGNKIKSTLFAIKGKFMEKINYAVSPPESTLLGGLIVGERSSFSAELRENFIKTGTIHIVALSGYNITIVAEWLMKFFKFLPRNLGFGAGILGILLFVIMSGATSTAIRAGIMASLVLLARATGRDYDILRALILTAVVMLLINPLTLVYDASFQLSFIATVAVIFFAPKIKNNFTWVTERWGVREVVSSTCAAYIFVLPFILYKMGNLSLVALPANFLILPFIPFTMLLGFLTGFVGLISKFISLPFGLVSYALLHYELWVINFFANIQFASYSIPNFPLILTLLIYAYFIYLLFGKSIKEFFKEV